MELERAWLFVASAVLKTDLWSGCLWGMFLFTCIGPRARWAALGCRFRVLGSYCWPMCLLGNVRRVEIEQIINRWILSLFSFKSLYRLEPKWGLLFTALRNPLACLPSILYWSTSRMSLWVWISSPRMMWQVGFFSTGRLRRVEIEFIRSAMLAFL